MSGGSGPLTVPPTLKRYITKFLLFGVSRTEIDTSPVGGAYVVISGPRLERRKGVGDAGRFASKNAVSGRENRVLNFGDPPCKTRDTFRILVQDPL